MVAFVILNKRKLTDMEKLKIHCQSLAYFKRPKHFFVVDSFPTTPGPNGEKIIRNKLVEMAQSMIVS